MSIKINVELTPVQVEAAIREYLAKEGFNVSAVTFNTTARNDDYFGRGSPTYEFSGADVKVTLKDSHTSSRSVNSLAAQIAAVDGDLRQYGDH